MAKLSIHEIDAAYEELNYALEVEADNAFDDDWRDELKPEGYEEPLDPWLYEDDFDPYDHYHDPYYDSIYHDDDFL